MEIFFAMIIMGAIGALFGKRKGRQLAGFLWGAILGPIGWLVVFLGPTIEPPK